LAGLALGLLPRLLLEAHADQLGLAPGLLLHLGHQPLLGFLGGQAGDALQRAALLLDEAEVPLLQLLEAALAAREALLLRVVVAAAAPVDLVQPSRDLLLLLAEPALDRLDLPLPLLDLLLELDPRPVDDLLGLDRRVLQLGLGALLGLLHDAAALLGRLADLA